MTRILRAGLGPAASSNLHDPVFVLEAKRVE